MRGFTFIEMLIYSGLFSVLFIGVTSTWLGIAHSNALFERLAKSQEVSVFAAETIDAFADTQSDYTQAASLIRSSSWHAIAMPIVSVESTTSLSHLSVTFSLLTASSSWQLDYYHAY